MAARKRGEEAVPVRIDHLAASEPHKICFSIPNCRTDPSQGWRDISFRDFANAANHAAHYLSKTLGGQSDKLDCIAYVGPNDVRYPILVVGAMKAGYKALLVSPRNSVEGQLSLLSKANAVAFFYGEDFRQLLEPVLQKLTVPAHVIPSKADWLDQPWIEFPFVSNKSLEDLAMQPALALHTSGSTGIPKPVDLKHGIYMASDRMYGEKSTTYDRPLYPHRFLDLKRWFLPLPLFHAAGMQCILNIPFFADTVVVLPPEGRPVTADLMAECFQHANVDGSLIAPSVLDEMSSIPEHVALMAKLDYICCGGGPTSVATAETLCGHADIHCMNVIASTETADLPLLVAKPDEFPWFFFDEQLGGLDMRKIEAAEDEELYEMWIKRLPGDAWRNQGIFYTFPDIDEYNTKDIFRKHPTKQGFFRYSSRSDDVIVFSNGEKLNPVDIERAVMAHPKVKGALVVGQGRFQPALLVEPVENPESAEASDALVDDIWPIVEDLNGQTVTHGQILKRLVQPTVPDKPFPRAGKGTIQRPKANALYASEIEEAYASLPDDDSNAFTVSTTSESALAESILQALRQILKNRSDGLSLDTDIFAAGVDSMQVLTLSRNLQATLDASQIAVDPRSVTPRAIYANLTPRKIAHSLYVQIDSSQAASPQEDNPASSDPEQEVKEMEELIERFTKDLPSIPASAPASDTTAVLITGTTGALGPYLLAALQDSGTSHIYAVNRSPDAESRQQATHEERGLSTDFSRVTFITSTLAEPDFSVSAELFAQLKSSVGRIIHNAWPVNFTIPLHAFLPSITSVRNLVDFAAASELRPHIAFVTTIGTISQAASPVPEAAQPPSAASLGYGQSKVVSSSVLDQARERGLRAAVIRVGQIAGPLGRGVWNQREWFPTLLKSSAGMGLLPSELGGLGARVDWLPVEAVAQVVTRISRKDAEGYFHAVNPNATAWSALLPSVEAWFQGRCKTVSLSAWNAELERRSGEATTAAEVEAVPGVKLLEFYQGMAEADVKVLETQRTQEVVEGLGAWGVVQGAWLTHWLQGWDY